MEKKSRTKIYRLKNLSKLLFAKFFAFEEGIDITKDVAVLHRRNVVIKNITFISNLFYSTLLLILSISTKETTDWAITLISFPLTYLINKLLKTLINLDKEDKTKQMIAMYVSSFYLFLSAVLMYARLYNSNTFETVSYILIYYAIVVISLYQDKRLLSTAFTYLFVLVTIIHIVWTYQIINMSQGLTIAEFFKEFVKTNAFGDLILRSLVFSLFYLVVYVIVSIGQYMQEERKNELMKRKKVQDDFSIIVGDLFQAFFINAYIYVNEKHAKQVQKIAEKISEFVGMSSTDIMNLSDYSLIHLRYEELKNVNISSNIYDDKNYELLKGKTSLGTSIVKRIELSQNCEAIVRSHVESTLTPEKIVAIMKTQPEQENQIILLADIYVTLRSMSSYKRPLTHNLSIDFFKKQLAPFFNQELGDRFVKFADELADIYDNFS